MLDKIFFTQGLVYHEEICCQACPRILLDMKSYTSTAHKREQLIIFPDLSQVVNTFFKCVLE